MTVIKIQRPAVFGRPRVTTIVRAGRRLFGCALLAIVPLAPASCGTAGQIEPRDEQLKVMSFNLRYGTAEDGENSWPNRRELVFDVIARHSPDIIGVQEALRFQLDELAEALPQYSEIGVGRDDGRQAGEYAAILYRRNRFDVEDQSTFWFSDTPETPGSVGWGTRVRRICTWARLFDSWSGRSFYLYNVHFDPQSQESRQKSAVLLAARIADRVTADPAIVTGDFNEGEDGPAMEYLTGKAISPSPTRLTDTFRVLYPDSSVVGTFNGFEGRTKSSKIDAVLVSEGWRVEAAAIVRDSRGGRYPSDHYPVSARIVYPRSPER